jgi:DNA adenine methylase
MKEKVMVPPIKSQGIKTKMVPWIKSAIAESKFDVWIEPFMGTGVVGFNVNPKKAICSDTNPHLINFYNELKNGAITASVTKNFLQSEGQKLLSSEGAYYYDVRNRFNEEKSPLDFLFLSRSCFNGMMRFNKKGGYNVPFCKKPNRFAQALVTKITNQVERISYVIKKGDFTFVEQDFGDTIAMATKKDLIYCDPPYIGRNVDYFDSWNEDDENDLFMRLSNSKSKFILSTWLLNKYRKNNYIFELWKDYGIDFNEHFYHVGGSEKNRNAVYEALLSNISSEKFIPVSEVLKAINNKAKLKVAGDTKQNDQLRLFLEKSIKGFANEDIPQLFSVTG